MHPPPAVPAKEEGSPGVLLGAGVRGHVGFLESSGRMLFHTAVAPLSPKGEEREECCMKLLGADNLFGGTMGLAGNWAELFGMVAVP